MPLARLDDAVILRLVCARLDSALSAEIAFVPPGRPEPADAEGFCRLTALSIDPATRQRDDGSSDVASGTLELLVAVSAAAAQADAYAMAAACKQVCDALDSVHLRDAATACNLQLEAAARRIGLDIDPEAGLMASTVTVAFTAIREAGDSAEDHL